MSLSEWAKFKHRWRVNWNSIALLVAAIIFVFLFSYAAPVPCAIAGFCAAWYILWLGLKCVRFPRSIFDLFVGGLLLVVGLSAAFWYTLICLGMLIYLLGWA